MLAKLNARPTATAFRHGSMGIVASAALLTAGCSSVPLKPAGTLQSYERLGPTQGKVSKSRTFVDAAALSAVRSASIEPTRFSPGAAARVLKVEDRVLVANALDRATCIALSDKYVMAPAGQPADLVVRTVITDVVPTSVGAAGVSTVVTLGSGALLPVSIPRLPLGLGGLAVEAEALDRGGTQRAAILWARGANSITNNPRMSEVGDAYALASSFAGHFSSLLITGKEPSLVSLSPPAAHRVRSFFGGKPKYAACDAFGREPGVPGLLAGKFGAPPSWTDKSRPPSRTGDRQSSVVAR